MTISERNISLRILTKVGGPKSSVDDFLWPGINGQKPIDPGPGQEKNKKSGTGPGPRKF